MSKSKRLHPAWIAAVITFFTLVATSGFRAAPSVLIVPLQDYFGWSRSAISSAVSINVLIYGLTAPFAAALMERFGIRRVVMCALTIVGSGAWCTQYISHPWHLAVLWGLIVGGGTGAMALVFAASVANRWFIQRKGLVIGILTAASAAGNLIFLPGLSSLVTRYGWRSVSVTVGLSAWAMVPAIYFFLKESPMHAAVKPYGAPDDYEYPEVVRRNAGREAIDTLVAAVKVKDFWLLCGSFFVCGLSTSGLIGTHFIPAAMDHGMVMGTAASLLALVGVFDVIGTMGSGWLTDRIDPVKLLFFYYGFRGLSLFLLPSILFQSVHPTTLVFVIFYGLDWVATVPPTIILCRRVLGPGRGTVVYGWVFAFHQIGGSIAALGGAIIHDKLGNYAAAFYGAGILCIVASIAVLQISRTETNQTVRV
jgi:predicted MFS family arabinose efflux permease